MSVYLRKTKKLTEDDAQQQPQQTTVQGNAQVAAAAAQEIEKCNQDIVTCQNEINAAEQRYQDEKRKQNNKIVQLQKRIADLGGTAIAPATSNESVKVSVKVSKKLFEAVQLGKTDELSAAAAETFAALPQLSYYMDEKGCTTLAKRMLTFLNDQSWNDGENHWPEVVEFLKNTLSKANISLSTRETDEFINKFAEILKTKTMFSWIFGREVTNLVAANPAVEDLETPAEEDVIPEEEESYPYPVRNINRGRLYNRDF